MNLTTISQAILTMTSLEIAELTGKEHRHVLRDITVMLEELDLNKEGYAQTWTHPQNKQTYPVYALDRELTETLLTGYSTVLRRKVIARWRELENAQPKFDASTLTRIDILKLAMESEEGRIKAEAERDKAIATKAQIGSKREATAMANVAKANREVARLTDQLGFSVRQATILQVEDAIGQDFDFLPLRRWCQANEVIAESVPDKRYPKGVKAWPAAAWKACYGIDLSAITHGSAPQ